MKRAFLFASPMLLLSTLWLAAASPAASGLPRSTPEAQGIPSSAILDFIDAAEQKIDALHSFMLLRHGQVVAAGWWSPYGAELPHELYSLSKSFTSTAVGLAIAEGKMSLDDTVLSYFPDDAPSNPSNHLKAMRVRDLLCMSTGQEKEPATGPAQVSTKNFLAQPVSFKPGTHFLYNTAATFMLSAIIQKVTGQTLLDYLTPRLFEPLGISRPIWLTNFQGISLGGYGLSVRTEDIARFGQLYLQQGRWNGKAIVPASWVAAATSRQTSNGSNPQSDWDQGYGFQFWRCRHAAYRGDGAFGQYCLVLPEQDAVLAITSGVRDMQAVLNMVWDKLLPAMQPKRLPKNAAAQRKLEERLARLELRTPSGSATTPLAAQFAGRTFVIPANDPRLEALAIQPDSDGKTLTLNLRSNGKTQQVRCPNGRWEKGRLALGTNSERAVASSGAWVTEDTYQARLFFYETPFCATLQMRFAGNQLFYDLEYNVAFGPTKMPQLLGQAQ